MAAGDPWMFSCHVLARCRVIFVNICQKLWLGEQLIQYLQLASSFLIYPVANSKKIPSKCLRLPVFTHAFQSNLYPVGVAVEVNYSVEVEEHKIFL
jgi:hypothetical protein